MGYTTTDNLLSYLDTTELPVDVDRLIERASELIDYVTFGKIAAGEHAEKATNAQIEFWLNGSGEGSDIQGEIKGYSVGSVSVDYGDNETPVLAPRAERILRLNGYLNRSVRRG